MHTPTKKEKEVILTLFELIKKKWEVYLPLEGTNKFVVLRTICSKCGANWYVDEKECFFCKMRYLRAIRCHKCKKILAEENLRHCPNCKADVGKRGCLNCGKKEEGQFVPITFCNKCGNRKNRIEYRIIEL
jgi:hypothetical protein